MIIIIITNDQQHLLIILIIKYHKTIYDKLIEALHYSDEKSSLKKKTVTTAPQKFMCAKDTETLFDNYLNLQRSFHKIEVRHTVDRYV